MPRGFSLHRPGQRLRNSRLPPLGKPFRVVKVQFTRILEWGKVQQPYTFTNSGARELSLHGLAACVWLDHDIDPFIAVELMGVACFVPIPGSRQPGGFNATAP
jgi:hypothetical protein